MPKRPLESSARSRRSPRSRDDSRPSHCTLLLTALLAVAAVSCQTSPSTEGKSSAAEETTGASPTSSAAQPTVTSYELPVAREEIGLDTDVQIGRGNRVLLVHGDRYWIISTDDVDSGGTPTTVEQGRWSTYREDVTLHSDDDPPAAVRDFAARVDAVGGVAAGSHFTRRVDETCWQLRSTEEGWRAGELESSCVDHNGWLFKVTEHGESRRFDFFNGESFRYDGELGGLALASQTWPVGFDQICQCGFHPRYMYGTDRGDGLPEDRRLVDDIGCKCQGGSLSFPVEGSQFADVAGTLDGSLAVLVLTSDGPRLHVARVAGDTAD